MNDKEFGKALLNWDARSQMPSVDARDQVAFVLRHDRRQVRWLAMGAIVLWILTAIGIPLFAWIYLEWVFPKVNWLLREIITHEQSVEPQALVQTLDTLIAVTLKMSVVLVAGSVAALLLAAGCTIWLVFAARRATLREVNANLAEIGEQLKRLQPASK